VIVGLRDATVATCGAKAGTLGRLARAGFRVPDGFVLPFGTREVPAAELARWLAAMGDPPVAVRSSASVEDGADASAAGQHDSFLGVRGAGAVAAAVRACRASLGSERAVAYRRESAPAPSRPSPSPSAPRPAEGTAQGRGDGAEMAVLVQRHIGADVAGVLFTGEPARVEASWGLGESVVHGLVTPDAWTVAAGGGAGRVSAVAARSVGDKRTRIDLGADGLATRPVPPADRSRPCLDDAQVVRLVAVGAELADVLGMPLDVEWAVAGGEIWILQARAITAALPPPPAPGRTEEVQATGGGRVIGGGAQSKASAGGGRVIGGGAQSKAPGARDGIALAGVPGSAGVATGPARIVGGPADFGRVDPGDVIVCRTTDPAWTPLLAVAAAVVTETGGVLSHAAIVARERRIPAVLGVPHALTAITDGEPVTVDGAAGTVSRAARY
jgi:pyruvate,water dikinase